MMRTRSPRKVDDIPIAPSLYSLSNKMGNSLLAVRDINHIYIVVERSKKMICKHNQSGTCYCQDCTFEACSHLLCRFCEDPALDGTCTCKCYQPEKSAASDKKNKNICNTLTCNSCICKNCNAEYCPRYDCNQCRNMFPHTVEPQFFCSGQK